MSTDDTHGPAGATPDPAELVQDPAPRVPPYHPCPSCGERVKVNADGRLSKHPRRVPLPCPGSYVPVGPARIPKRGGDGWYRDPVTGQRLRSVTTTLNQGSAKEALTFWAAKIVAELALDQVPDLVRAARNPAERTEMIDWLRAEPIRRRDDRGDVGKAVHRVIEARILGETVPPSLLADGSLRPYLRHFFAFVADWQVEFEASEMVVAHYAHQYAGTLDYLFYSAPLAARLGVPTGTLFAGDTKTGGELDQITYGGHRRGVYPEAGLQMAAYRAAPYGWLRSGERIAMPPRHEVGVVLHLRPGGYRLIPVRCGDAEYAVFRHIQAVAAWSTGAAKTVIGQPLAPPDPPTTPIRQAA
ncbi:hypothetical protein [Bailinhaonella thermotolerans]|uniref:Uncharacterized protein n=1 Tax=Bailinhaonella thermotolerans TaxID=1070861 RepID=A0A3A4A643_9ACTN|nr:hypothetical protein [Bailinhaonella thermotolerans]RJL21077.1 hypothetical protein D5H75_38340 [Bailinhaonella thermotolerans]